VASSPTMMIASELLSTAGSVLLAILLLVLLCAGNGNGNDGFAGGHAVVEARTADASFAFVLDTTNNEARCWASSSTAFRRGGSQEQAATVGGP